MIRARVTRSSNGRNAIHPAVIVVHGFKGFLSWGFFPELHARLARSGIAAVAINLSGSGVGEDLESFTEDSAFESSTPSRDVEDVACVRALLDRGGLAGVDPARLGLLGHSRGGGTILLHAAERSDYRAIVTWAAVSRTLRYPRAVIERWKEQGVIEIPNLRTGKIHRLGSDWLEDAERNREALDILAACRKLQTPTLLVHGTADESVPFTEAQELAAALPSRTGRLFAIPGAGHTFGATHPFQGISAELERVLDSSVNFLSEKLSSSGP